MKPNQIRIIGGMWRGRTLQVAENDVRPTPNRVRETVFNWLAPHLIDSNCLDCFAGSGILGLEALSRGAKKAVLLDRDPNVLQLLEVNKAVLHAAHATIRQANIPQDLSHYRDDYDIVFLDPPFGKGYINACCRSIQLHQCVKAGGLVYLETELSIQQLEIPSTWTILKKSKAGKVYFFLCEVQYV